jgi:hypothetical protein
MNSKKEIQSKNQPNPKHRINPMNPGSDITTNTGSDIPMNPSSDNLINPSSDNQINQRS